MDNIAMNQLSYATMILATEKMKAEPSEAVIQACQSLMNALTHANRFVSHIELSQPRESRLLTCQEIDNADNF